MISGALSVSVVIANWNYAEFLRVAVDSALALDWPDVEVIVVDDGSTDGSRGVIDSYGGRILALYQANGGQRAACNTGFARTRGDVVIFLDADDKLEPSLVHELAAVWRPSTSKVQFQMRVIDAGGKPTGAVFPQFDGVPTPRQIRQWAMRAGAYPTPPGSGNAYARWFLDEIFPLTGDEPASDSYCLAAAPYLGEVMTVAKPLVCYRVHGRNDSAMSTLEVGRFAHELRRAQWRFRYGQQIARGAGMPIPDRVFRNSLAVLPYRLASLRLAPAQHPIAGDSLAAIVRDTLRAFFVPQGRGLAARLALLVWTLLVALLPESASKSLVVWRFVSPSRPPVVRRALAILRL
jgi:glycosyltransferase involved in cell wall biosynthesis